MADLFGHLGMEIIGAFRHQHRRGPHGYAHIQGQISGVAAHDLHHGAALMGLHGVPQLVDALHRRVGGGVEADGVFGADNVVVDGAGDAHHGYAAFAELLGSPEGAVAADGHDAVQPQQLAHAGGLGLALRRAELLAAGGIENGAAAVDDAADAAGIHAVKIPVDEAGPAPADADALDAPIQSRAHHGPHRRIHARCVAAAGQHADSFHCAFCHK